MKPKTTRWKRNYTTIAKYYYLWKTEVMKKPEYNYDVELMNKFIKVPDLVFGSFK